MHSVALAGQKYYNIYYNETLDSEFVSVMKLAEEKNNKSSRDHRFVKRKMPKKNWISDCDSLGSCN